MILITCSSQFSKNGEQKDRSGQIKLLPCNRLKCNSQYGNVHKQGTLRLGHISNRLFYQNYTFASLKWFTIQFFV